MFASAKDNVTDPAGAAATLERSHCVLLKGGPTFQLLHVNKLEETTLATPALVDGRWYIRTDRNLYAIGK